MALFAGTAGAQARQELRFDPHKIEFATPWAQSSPCLGDTHDPVCFVQTVVVCWTLHRRPECATGRYGESSNPQGHQRVEYRIARAGHVPFERLETMQESLIGEYDLTRNPMTRRRPVIWQFVIRRSLCPAAEASCEGHLWTDILVVVERVRREWRFVAALYDGGDYWFAD